MDTVRTCAALAGAGFRRYSTYRQATVAGAFTNIVFGFLRCYVLLSIAGEAGELAGYDVRQLATFVWVSQGLLAVVGAWGMLDLADRVRSGDVVADLLRPLGPFAVYLCTDLGRLGFAVLTRLTAPVAAGLVFFELYLPADPITYPMFGVSVLLATLIAFCARYLIGLSAFWLLDIRGLTMLWVFVWGAGSGMYFPLPILPGWAQLALWLGTPFPAMAQAPLDILVERGGAGHAWLVLLDQCVWLAIGLVVCARVQRRAWRKLVVQGG
ncbi:MAG TPA: ABC-2 family transporter protein [Actinophytocola sp.]|uniref:ABC transporter permease n=1 Tax=Actinophytocola sp. TaxID=1872138 RepID=UPI002DC008F0|nr:ABC-2 family transporter protein [Actinophytocola sp.]HEU5469909.1 ABC-2 family transporter protein [Actinophytocola sp.]